MEPLASWTTEAPRLKVSRLVRGTRLAELAGAEPCRGAATTPRSGRSGSAGADRKPKQRKSRRPRMTRGELTAAYAQPQARGGDSCTTRRSGGPGAAAG